MTLESCPVCGVPFEESILVEDLRMCWDICICCGCEYGLDDSTEYRAEWLRRGSPWSYRDRQPANWNLREQLTHILPEWDGCNGHWQWPPIHTVPSFTTIADAGNVVIAAWMALAQRGCSVRREWLESSKQFLWHAEGSTSHLIAGDVVALLALAALLQRRGADWQASDEQTAHFLQTYGEESPDR